MKSEDLLKVEGHILKLSSWIKVNWARDEGNYWNDNGCQY